MSDSKSERVKAIIGTLTVIYGLYQIILYCVRKNTEMDADKELAKRKKQAKALKGLMEG